MTRLSVNVNKIATLRNARGGQNPNLVSMVKDIESFGAQGITVHPRPDERHITKQDVYNLSKIVKTEFNIEGYPNDRLLEMVKDVKPDQVTLVPDGPDAITSNAGWDTKKNTAFLKDVVSKLKPYCGRVSIFLDPEPDLVNQVVEIKADRIELYTESYAVGYHQDKEKAIAPFIKTANKAEELGVLVNAGHDLDLQNLAFFKQQINVLKEVSIGHALVCDALYLGIENTIGAYLRKLIK